MEDQRTRTTIIIAAIVLLFPAFYVGSYLALVLPSGRLKPTGAPGDYAIVYYRAGGDSPQSIGPPSNSIAGFARSAGMRTCCGIGTENTLEHGMPGQ